MFEFALRPPGCLGFESACGADGRGITVAYFADETVIVAWQENARDPTAQRMGKERWYSHYCFIASRGQGRAPIRAPKAANS